MAIDTTNKGMVGVTLADYSIYIMIPRGVMTREEALVHAAWIVALADPGGDRFPAVLAAVRNT